jgi:hypothetical protein
MHIQNQEEILKNCLTLEEKISMCLGTIRYGSLINRMMPESFDWMNIESSQDIGTNHGGIVGGMNKRRFSGSVLSLRCWMISLSENMDRLIAIASSPLSAVAELVSSIKGRSSIHLHVFSGSAILESGIAFTAVITRIFIFSNKRFGRRYQI